MPIGSGAVRMFEPGPTVASHMRVAVIGGSEVIRKCRRYHRLIDRTPRIWFHVFEENSMKPLERLTHHASFRIGIIVLGAMICLALWSPSALRTAPAMLAATAIDGASATPATAETSDKEIR